MKKPPRRARHGGEAEDRPDEAHVAAPLPGRDDVGDDRLDADHESAAADALDGAEGDEFVHGARPACQGGADHEDDDRELEDALAAEEVAELPVDRQADRGGEEIGGDRPGHLVQAVQLADDLRQCGGDDHLVERREQQGEHQPEEDQPDPAGADLVRRGGRPGGGRWRGRLGLHRGTGLHPGPGHPVLRASRLVLHQSDPTHHVTLPSSQLRRPFLASGGKAGQTRPGARRAHSEGLCAGGRRYGAQPATPENHSFR